MKPPAPPAFAPPSVFVSWVQCLRPPSASGTGSVSQSHRLFPHPLSYKPAGTAFVSTTVGPAWGGGGPGPAAGHSHTRDPCLSPQTVFPGLPSLAPFLMSWFWHQPAPHLIPFSEGIRNPPHQSGLPPSHSVQITGDCVSVTVSISVTPAFSEGSSLPLHRPPGHCLPGSLTPSLPLSHLLIPLPFPNF